jgi:hypothetical protein
LFVTQCDGILSGKVQQQSALLLRVEQRGRGHTLHTLHTHTYTHTGWGSRVCGQDLRGKKGNTVLCCEIKYKSDRLRQQVKRVQEKHHMLRKQVK